MRMMTIAWSDIKRVRVYEISDLKYKQVQQFMVKSLRRAEEGKTVTEEDSKLKGTCDKARRSLGRVHHKRTTTTGIYQTASLELGFYSLLRPNPCKSSAK